MNRVFLLAAGSGKRFGGDKLRLSLGGQPVFAHALEVFEKLDEVDEIYIAVREGEQPEFEAFVQTAGWHKVCGVFAGGEGRLESVQRLVSAVGPSYQDHDYLIIHNAANPFAEGDEVRRALAACRPPVRGVAVGRPVQNTIKRLGAEGRVEETVAREQLWEVETPQVVHALSFTQALRRLGPLVTSTPERLTDDLSVLEAAGFETRVVEVGSIWNRKLTTHFELAAFRWKGGEPSEAQSVGIGEDGHAYGGLVAAEVSALPLPGGLPVEMSGSGGVLAGVRFEEVPAVEAESDGDVILHALCNALSSSIGECSLGGYATPLCRNGVTDSREYLALILQKVAAAGLSLIHCSLSIEALHPKIDPLVPALKNSLSQLLGLSLERIGITATTGGGTRFIKGNDGIYCRVVVLLARSCFFPPYAENTGTRQS